METLTLEQVILHDVMDRPEDDLPRLAYADWLEENASEVPCDRCKEQGWIPRVYGLEETEYEEECKTCHGKGTVTDGRKERAEFIRVQVELAKPCKFGFSNKYHIDDSCPACDRLYKRQNELLNLPLEPQNGAFAWSMPLHSRTSFLGRAWMDVIKFRRGFVDEISLTLRQFLDNAAVLFESLPITKVTITDRRPKCFELDRWGWYTARMDAYRHDKDDLTPIFQDVLVGQGGKQSSYWIYFPSEQAAVEAAGKAAVLLGTRLRSWNHDSYK